MGEKVGKSVRLFFFWFFFLRNRDLFSSTQKSHNVAIGGCSNFTFLLYLGEARASVQV